MEGTILGPDQSVLGAPCCFPTRRASTRIFLAPSSPLYMFLGPPDRCPSPSCACRPWPRRHDRTKTERYPKNSSVEVRPRASSRGANTTTRDGFGRLNPPLT